MSKTENRFKKCIKGNMKRSLKSSYSYNIFHTNHNSSGCYITDKSYPMSKVTVAWPRNMDAEFKPGKLRFS